MSDPAPRCLRCRDVALVPAASSPADVTFYECPTCGRPYAKAAGGPLTYRWLHPVSLPLYCVLFSPEPVPEAERVARDFVQRESDEHLCVLLDEIELELREPTQTVRDIIDNPQPEETCRAFLRAFVDHARAMKRA
jgi:hypothetical protein